MSGTAEDAMNGLLTQPSRGLELRDWLKFLERRGEGVRERPEGSRRELVMCGIEVTIVHRMRQVPGHFQLPFNEGLRKSPSWPLH
jgi:hypothetical protein